MGISVEFGVRVKGLSGQGLWAGFRGRGPGFGSPHTSSGVAQASGLGTMGFVLQCCLSRYKLAACLSCGCQHFTDIHFLLPKIIVMCLACSRRLRAACPGYMVFTLKDKVVDTPFKDAWASLAVNGVFTKRFPQTVEELTKIAGALNAIGLPYDKWEDGVTATQ